MRRFHVFLIVAFLLSSFVVTTSSALATNQGDQSWTLTASVRLCDDNPQIAGEAANCTPADDVKILVYQLGETFVGSCVTEVIDTPWGNQMAYCAVDGAPFNTTLIVSQDPATIPAGYTPLVPAESVVVGDLIPGGGDQTTVTFTNIANASNAGDQNDSPSDSSNGNSSVEFFAAVHHGTCANIQSVVSALIPVRFESGAAVGNSSAIKLPTSSTTVSESLDVLIDEQHAVVIHQGIQPESDVMLCGNIGGVDNDDGQLFIGLTSNGVAGYSGVAILSYGDSEATTDVRVFVIPY